MAILNELESVGAYVKLAVPSSAIRYDVPTKPANGDVVVRMLTTDTESETRYHYRVERSYQIVVYGADAPTVLEKMDAISRKVNDGKTVIPIKDSLRFIRAGSFSYSAAFKTEGGMTACVGVLQTEIREVRTQEEYEKIWHVYGRYEFRVPINNE